MKRRIWTSLLSLILILPALFFTVLAGEEAIPEGLEYEVYSDYVEITDYEGNATNLTIPAEIGGIPVTCIGYYSFSGCSSLTNITIPDTVTTIEDGAFQACSGLISISIPDSVTRIGKYAFIKCSSLASITIPDGLTCLDDNIFQGCSNLSSITIPTSVTSIGGLAFFECSSLTTITIPDNVTSIGSYAFSGCSSLISIIVPEGVTSLGNDAFSDCTSLIEVILPDSLTVIKSDTFRNCTSLDRIRLPAKLTSIGDEAFYYCHSLNSIAIPASLTSIGYCAFGRTYYLHDIYYAGTEEQWNAIDIDLENSHLENVTIHFESTGDPEDHIHNYTAVVTAPICTEDGYTTYTCSCGDSYTGDEISALGHDFGDWYIIREATQEEVGEEKRDCSRCDASETRDIPRMGHTHSYTSAVTVATCTESGYTTYTCSCGDSYIADETPALGHSFSQWITIRAASCVEEGLKIRTCARCFQGDPQPIDATGHDYVDGTCTLCGEADPDYQEPVVNPFTDVPGGAWYETPVLWAVENSITAGTGNGNFSPNQTCTRGQVVTFLWRAVGEPEPESNENPFSDVASGDYFYKAVLWAVENGITSGTGNGNFSPNNPCTRDQVVTFLWRAMGKPTAENRNNPFSDVAEGIYYYEPVLWAVEQGITSGTSATTFAPGSPCTRAQVVTFLYRAMAEE